MPVLGGWFELIDEDFNCSVIVRRDQDFPADVWSGGLVVRIQILKLRLDNQLRDWRKDGGCYDMVMS